MRGMGRISLAGAALGEPKAARGRMTPALRRVWRAAESVSVALLLAAFAEAQSSAPATASGRFATEKRSFDIHGAYAFWVRSGERDHEPLLRVAVSNDRFKAEAFDAFYDPEKVIETEFIDESTYVVYFEFEPGGQYHGLSYYFGSGDGCGYCYDSSVHSTVRIAGERLTGSLSFQEPHRSFQLDLNVPVPPRHWGKPLPADGGDPGKTVLAYQTALETRNQKALFDLLTGEGQQLWSQREKEGKLDRALEYRWAKEHLELTQPQITGGYVRGEDAVVLVKGKNSYSSLKGEVALRREGSRWRIRDEIFGVGD
jgi:hypothetical protein